MLPPKIEPKRSWAWWTSYRDVELTRRIYTLEQTVNKIISHLEEKERNEAEFVKNWNAQSIQLPEEKECEYPNKNMDCYCEICIYCKEAILKNQQTR